MKRKLIFMFILISIISSQIFAEENASLQNEKAQFLSDMRRLEVISLGALPFVTMDVSLVYTGIKSVTNDDSTNKITPTPFAQFKYDPETDGAFWSSDCGKVIMYSAIASLSVGLTDYVIHLIKRGTFSSKNKKNTEKNIIISDLENDPDATKLSLPQNETLNQKESTK